MSLIPRLGVAAVVAVATLTLGGIMSGSGRARDLSDWRMPHPPGFWTRAGELIRYPDPWRPCGVINDFDQPPRLASDIEASGLGCRAARRFIRRAHEPCGSETCRFEGYHCIVDYAGTQTLGAYCARDAHRRVKWYWTILY